MYSSVDTFAQTSHLDETGISMLPLAVRDLVYEVQGRRLIDQACLDLSAQGITTVMGPNGAGKSLLIRLLHGLIEPTSGEIHWNDEPMGKQARMRQAMVFQRPVLLRRSVAANIDFVLSLNGEPDTARRDEILHHAGLHEHASKPARRLSGGEQQRLALARALATGPQVLFLDEPTASLDPASVVQIERVIRDAARKGVKVIMISHDIGQAARLSSDIVFLHNGRVIEHCQSQRFFSGPGSRKAQDYLNGQILL